MTKGVQLLFYHRDADCFFIVHSRCDLGLRSRFGIIAALSQRLVIPVIDDLSEVRITGISTAQLNR